ncbi:MAG: PspC domain-containing protein [Balneola sp.]|nr:MAG: PspC domain-containing protein [Balneola sp.]
MAEKTKEKTYSKTGTASLEFDDFELQNTMRNFLKEEEKETGKGIWNFATIAGLAMLFFALSSVLQFIGISFGVGFASFLEGATASMPLIGGALVTLIGFGFLVGDRKREQKAEKEIRRNKKAKVKAASVSSRKKMDDVHGSEFNTSTKSTLRNDLDSDFMSSSSSTNFEDFAMGSSYEYRHVKKLMKSRTNKKLAGVCGGLAKYFGISPTVVRFIFVAGFFMSYGVLSTIIYLGLALAMPKEPVELMDDFDF